MRVATYSDNGAIYSMSENEKAILKAKWQEARQALEDGETFVALSLAERFTVDYPRSSAGWILLGRTQRRLNLIEQALASFRKALNLASKSKRTCIAANIGMLLHDQGALADAEAAYREALCNAPDDGPLYILLGCTLARQGRFDEAKSAHQRAIELGNADSDEAYLNLALILRNEGNEERALEMVEKALEIDPSHGPTTDLHTELLASSKLKN